VQPKELELQELLRVQEAAWQQKQHQERNVSVTS